MDTLTDSFQPHEMSGPITPSIETMTTSSDLLQVPQGRAKRLKTASPPLSTMTPPPSSQQPRAIPASPPLAASTPQRSSIMSSPPPTVHRATSIDALTPAIVEITSPEELRRLLLTAKEEISSLTSQLNEARTSAAHYKLQYKFLSIETQEASKRMDVEHEMTKREVQVLRIADQTRRREQSSPLSFTGDQSSQILPKGHELQALRIEAETSKRRLQAAKDLILDTQDRVDVLVEENKRLKKRIRDNREHLDRVRQPGGLYGTPSIRGMDTVPSTPQRPIQRQPRSSNVNEPTSIAALLLADQVLSQESSSPQPKKRRQTPVTPSYGRTPGKVPALLPPVSFSMDNTSKHRRRRSRDSTISAPDIDSSTEPAAAQVDDITDDDEAVPASQASQLATSMLRESPTSHIEVLTSPTTDGAGSEPNAQSSEHTLKRKAEDDLEGQNKRGAVGLGIHDKQ